MHACPESESSEAQEHANSKSKQVNTVEGDGKHRNGKERNEK